MSLEKALRKLYDQEINIRIQCCWDAGWFVYFQDPISQKWARKTWCLDIEKIKDVIYRELDKNERYAKKNQQQRTTDTGTPSKT